MGMFVAGGGKWVCLNEHCDPLMVAVVEAVEVVVVVEWK